MLSPAETPMPDMPASRANKTTEGFTKIKEGGPRCPHVVPRFLKQQLGRAQRPVTNEKGSLSRSPEKSDAEEFTIVDQLSSLNHTHLGPSDASWAGTSQPA